MTDTRENLQAELQALEDQIAALKKHIHETDGIDEVRSVKELNDLLLVQRDVQETLEAIARSG